MLTHEIPFFSLRVNVFYLYITLFILLYYRISQSVFKKILLLFFNYLFYFLFIFFAEIHNYEDIMNSSGHLYHPGFQKNKKKRKIIFYFLVSHLIF